MSLEHDIGFSPWLRRQCKKYDYEREIEKSITYENPAEIECLPFSRQSTHRCEFRCA